MKLDKTGTILIASLWIVAILSILAIGIGFRVSLEMRLSRYSMDRLKALYLAKAGIVKSQELLSRDNKEDYDTLYECGVSFNIDETPESVFGAASNKLDNGSFSIYYTQKKEGGEGYETHYGLMDEERKININMSKIPSPNKVEEYKRIMHGLSSSLTDDIINAIIDWQDTDLTPLPGGGENNDYYQRLDHPYECKNGDFSCIEELLLVKDMRQDIFDEIKDYITVYTAGTININTTSQRVLNAIINDGEGRYNSLIAKIIDYRNGDNERDDENGRKDDVPIIQLSNISNLEEAESDRLTSLANYFMFGASNFRIESKGMIDRPRFEKVIICVATKEAGGNFKLISYREH